MDASYGLYGGFNKLLERIPIGKGILPQNGLIIPVKDLS